MRARYAAYALGLVDFIMATTDPAGPQWNNDTEGWQSSIQDFVRQTEFLRLTIHESKMTGGASGTVHFTATLRQSGADASFTERSGFVRHEGGWLYAWGEPLVFDPENQSSTGPD